MEGEREQEINIGMNHPQIVIPNQWDMSESFP